MPVGQSPRLVVTGQAVNLPADALYGITGEYVRAVAPLTEADPAGVLACLLTGAGSVIGRGVHHRIGKRHAGNLFTLLVGGTASRKGTCWSVADALLGLVDPGWHSACVEGGFGSGQGLVYRIRDARGDDPGVTDKRLMVVEEEFAKPLRLCRGETSILSANMRAAFDGVRLSVLNRGDNGYGVAEPHISVIGMTTGEELRELTKGRSEIVNGTINRFLIVGVQRAGYLPSGGDYYAVADGFAGRLAGALRAAAGAPFPAHLSPEAASVWDTEYVRLERLPEAGGDYGKAVGRLSVHCLKLALIYAALDGEGVIRLPHLRAALAFIRYADRSARDLFTDSRPTGQDRPSAASAAEPSLAERLHGLITTDPGVKKSALLRAVREPAEAVSKALGWLAEAGMAHPGKCRSPNGGPPAECWWPGAGDAVTTLPPFLPLEDPDPEPDPGRKEGTNWPATRETGGGQLVPSGKELTPDGGAGEGELVPSFPPSADGGSGDDRGGGEGVVTAHPSRDEPLTADAILAPLTPSAPVGGDAKASRGSLRCRDRDTPPGGLLA
ncbi:MAG: DUF3987 domain-containing protein [Gemmataceae bacterium]|nr:DUF3987 domain-containing protein [Gemmataceae bacterium]